MEIAKQSFNIIEQGTDLEDILKHIELCARVSYKSENRITDDSALAFVSRLSANGHSSPLEHGTLHAKVPHRIGWQWISNPYSRVSFELDGTACVSTNYRENEKQDFPCSLLPYLTDFDYKQHTRRVSVRFITNRAIANEFVRHRAFSFTQESTRWINYSKRGIAFIEPMIEDKSIWENTMIDAEIAYNAMIDRGVRPEQARGVLPLDLKTELVMTGFVDDWMHFFELRCAKAAHPQARELACGLRNEFIDRAYIDA